MGPGILWVLGGQKELGEVYIEKEQGEVYIERLKESDRGRELLKRIIQKEEPCQGDITAHTDMFREGEWLTHDWNVCKGEGPALWARHCSLGRFKITEGSVPQAWTEQVSLHNPVPKSHSHTQIHPKLLYHFFSIPSCPKE